METISSELQSLDQAKRMIDIFASVGARRFDVTFLDIEGKKRGFRPLQSTWQVKHSLPLLLPGLPERQNSLVVRPHSETSMLIQLDDLKAGTLAPLHGVAFLTLRTSPGNYQAWVAVAGLTDPKDFARRLRKGAQADISASGATRVAGTLNYKRKYEPGFPVVVLEEAHPGRIVTPAQVQQLGLLAPESAAPAAPLRVLWPEFDRQWPDYQRCLAGAPRNHADSGPDVSRADFYWSMVAAARGFGIDAIAEHLMQVSAKARENGELYARLTATNATAVALRKQERVR